MGFIIMVLIFGVIEIFPEGTSLSHSGVRV